MRYVAVSQPSPWSPMEIVGVGESMDEAYSGARAWFENAFDKFGDQRWNELVAMQNNLNAVPETELHEKTGVTLDEWLVRLAGLGQYPGTPQPPKPPKSPHVVNDRSGWELSVWMIAGIFVLAGPFLDLIYRLWFVSQEGELASSMALLLAIFITSVIFSIISSAFWFMVLRWFKSDATLADYLFILAIIQIAWWFVSALMGIGPAPDYPNF
jgi:hypothetical protein